MKAKGKKCTDPVVLYSPLKKAPLKKAQARRKPLVRPASAPCEVPAATACEAVGDGAAGVKPPAAEETPHAAGPK